MQHKNRPDGKTVYRQGFTLIEMAVVLVIIGMITAGIIAGEALIRQSQINSAMIDVQRYSAAVDTFRQKYGSLPGDMANATAYWGAMVTCPPSAGYATIATLVCNGNGNGQIDAAATEESFFFWQHLSVAKLIQGTYTGASTSAGLLGALPGTNVPLSRLPGAGFGIFYAGVRSGDTNYFDGTLGHILMFGGGQSANAPYSAVISTIDAASFDKKFDDGLPAYGNVQTWKATTGYTPNCATTAVSSTAAYKVASSGNLCSMVFVTGF